MNKVKKRILTLIAAVMLCMAAFPLTAHAGGGDEAADEPATETAVPEVAAEPNPFTPDGTGTVVDIATDEDGKVFYTITTPSENVFYLIIDHQRTDNNVYFLNAVTENDLMALAEPSDNTASQSAIPDDTAAVEPEPAATPDPEPEQEAEPEQGGGPGMIILAVVVILGAGGAGYYFKIYRPKQQGAASGDEYEEYEDTPASGADEWDTGDDSPPWDEDEAGLDVDYTDYTDEAREDYEADTGEGEDE